MKSLLSPQPGATDVSECLVQDLTRLKAEVLTDCREQELALMRL